MPALRHSIVPRRVIRLHRANIRPPPDIAQRHRGTRRHQARLRRDIPRPVLLATRQAPVKPALPLEKALLLERALLLAVSPERRRRAKARRGLPPRAERPQREATLLIPLQASRFR